MWRRINPLSLTRFHVVAGMPGWTHGLTFVGRQALVAFSKVRAKYCNALGPPLLDRVAVRKCGISIVDPDTREVVGTFEFKSGPTEIYDLGFVPGITRPQLDTTRSTQLRQSVGPARFSFSVESLASQSGRPGPRPGPGDATASKRPQATVAIDDGDGTGQAPAPAGP